MLYSISNSNSYDFFKVYLFMIVIVILGFIVEYIIKLLDFKKFAKENYDLDINVFIFTFQLICSKIKRHNTD